MLQIAWTEGPHFPQLVKGGAMGIVDGAPVYAAGVTQPWRESELAWRYDPDRKDWFPVEPMPLGRCYTTGATTNGAGEGGLLVVGGRKTFPGRPITALNDAWWLRRINDVWQWTELPRLEQPRIGAALAVVGDLAICAGGGDWEHTYGGAFTADAVTKVEALDLSNPQAGWRDLGEPPFSPRAACTAAVAAGNCYLFGGYNCWVDDGKVRHITYYDEVYRYDPASGTWSERARLPVKLYGNQAVAYADRYIVLMGGVARLPFCGQEIEVFTIRKDEKRGLLTGGYSDLVWVYDTRTDTFALLPERLPRGHNDMRACARFGVVYLVGGENADVSTSNTTDTFMIGHIET